MSPSPVFPPESSIESVRRWLAEHAGLEPGLMRHEWLDRVIRQRMEFRGVGDASGYCRLLQDEPQERDFIVREIAVGETCFFRYPESFELLVERLRRMRLQPGRAGLRLLSLGCATGEEAYSMAIAALHAGWPAGRVRIDACDRNQEALAGARSGRYLKQRNLQPVPAWAEPWLRDQEHGREVVPPVRSLVRFHRADALTPDFRLPAPPYAAVFCRNLLIYLHADARQRLVDRLVQALEPDGLLFVGHAEQLDILRRRLRTIERPAAFAFENRPATSGLKNAAAREESRRPRPKTRRTATLEPSGGQAGVPQQDKPAARGAAAAAANAAAANAAALAGSAAAAAAAAESSSRALVERARELADRGRLEDAVATLLEAEKSGPPDAERYRLLGTIQLARGLWHEARDALRGAVYLDPGHEEALLQLSVAYQRLGENNLAARYRRLAARAHAKSSGESLP